MERSIGIVNNPVWLSLKTGTEVTIIEKIEDARKRKSIRRSVGLIYKEHVHFIVVQRTNFRESFLKKDIMTGAVTLMKRK